MLSGAVEMPVRVIAGSYRGQCGVETRRTAKMVYVELDDGPTVRLMQCSVRRVIVERATESPTDIPEGSSKERVFRVGGAVRVVGGSYKGQRGIVDCRGCTSAMVYVKLVGLESVVCLFQSSVRLMKQCAPDLVGDHGLGTGRAATADDRAADAAATA
jgi:hypothetical protein